MDFASLVGVLSGLGMIIGAILYQGDVSSFVNVPGMMVVIGGTISATLLTFNLGDVILAIRTSTSVFFRKHEDPNDMLELMLDLSRHALHNGFTSLAKMEKDEYPEIINKAIQLTADNMNEGVISAALRTEIESVKLRDMVIQDIFRKMAMYAPSFGMIGTIIGLISMLSKMEDPSMVGPAMALALTTTFYGSLLSTMLFFPAAGKLRTHMIESVTNLEIVFTGSISILRGEHPMILYEKASAFIPVSKRREFKSDV